jgi:hypothetical protein
VHLNEPSILNIYLISICPVRTVVNRVRNSVAIFVVVGVAHVAEGVLVIVSLNDVSVEKQTNLSYFI